MSSIIDAVHVAGTNSTMNAAGQNRFTIGRIILEGGSGSKTISSSGGKLFLRTAAGVLSNAGTTVRVGIQDVGSDGIPDGTFDVYVDYVGGSATWAAAIRECVMGTGSKTVSHGDTIAIGVQMQSRGGSDQTVVVGLSNLLLGTHNFPYGITNGAKVTNLFVPYLIVFDDGTTGWIEELALIGSFNAAPDLPTAFHVNSTPDEYAALFRLPFKTRLAAAAVYVDSIATADNFEVILYSDALGTPAVIEAVTINPQHVGGASGIAWATFANRELVANAWYAIAVRPTTTNAIQVGYRDFGSGGEFWKKSQPFGADLKLAVRTNQSGAFVETQNYHMPFLRLRLNGFLG